MNQRIIIIDDDTAVRDSLSALLESAGFDVQVYCSGALFFSVAKRSEAHCLIIDTHMPQMSGLEIAKHLQRENNLIPIILITGQPNPTLKAHAAKCGITTILEKPFGHDALLQAVTDCQNHR